MKNNNMKNNNVRILSRNIILILFSLISTALYSVNAANAEQEAPSPECGGPRLSEAERKDNLEKLRLKIQLEELKQRPTLSKAQREYNLEQLKLTMPIEELKERLKLIEAERKDNLEKLRLEVQLEKQKQRPTLSKAQRKYNLKEQKLEHDIQKLAKEQQRLKTEEQRLKTEELKQKSADLERILKHCGKNVKKANIGDNIVIEYDQPGPEQSSSENVAPNTYLSGNFKAATVVTKASFVTARSEFNIEENGDTAKLEIRCSLLDTSKIYSKRTRLKFLLLHEMEDPKKKTESNKLEIDRYLTRIWVETDSKSLKNKTLPLCSFKLSKDQYEKVNKVEVIQQTQYENVLRETCACRDQRSEKLVQYGENNTKSSILGILNQPT